jgi:hypothetical protein
LGISKRLLIPPGFKIESFSPDNTSTGYLQLMLRLNMFGELYPRIFSHSLLNNTVNFSETKLDPKSVNNR